MKEIESKPYIFISYKTKIEDFVAKVCHCLERKAKIEYYFHPEGKSGGDFPEKLKKALKRCNMFVLFVVEETPGSHWQLKELNFWLDSHNNDIEKIALINMNKVKIDLKIEKLPGKDLERIFIVDHENDPLAPINCAEGILKLLRIPSAAFDDLPTLLDAKYEKDIIKLYEENKNGLPNEYIRKGYPPQWPKVHDYRAEAGYTVMDNPLDPRKYGQYRNDNSAISVDTRLQNLSKGECEKLSKSELTFPEAGPRERILVFPNTLHIGILVSGGIAPGINSVISAILDRHETYKKEFIETGINRFHKVEVFGFNEGYRSLCVPGIRFTELESSELSKWANRGGSFLPTARADQLLKADPVERERLFVQMVQRLAATQIEVLYVIGGEGSMRAAHALWTTHKRIYPDRRLSVIGIPKTMDNDILWVWQSLGFQSAVGEGTRNIIQCSTEASSNPRVGIIQLFGSSSGFVVSHAALGSNVCDLVLIPEMDFNMLEVCEYMCNRLNRRRQDRVGQRSPYGIIVMAETAIPNDFGKYIDEEYVGLTDKEKEALREFERNNRRVLGQTPDNLRSAGLKIVTRVLQQYIQGVMGRHENTALGARVNFTPQWGADLYWENYRIFTNEPRHLIRSMEPTVSDVAYGMRLGTMAVDMALAGYNDCMVSQWLTEYVVVPLKLVVLGRKQMPKEGIFWRTVISKTGQMEFDSLT